MVTVLSVLSAGRASRARGQEGVHLRASASDRCISRPAKGKERSVEPEPAGVSTAGRRHRSSSRRAGRRGSAPRSGGPHAGHAQPEPRALLEMVTARGGVFAQSREPPCSGPSATGLALPPVSSVRRRDSSPAGGGGRLVWGTRTASPCASPGAGQALAAAAAPTWSPGALWSARLP